MMDVLHILLFIMLLSSMTHADCSFPNELNGSWISADRGSVTINNTTIFGYDLTIPGITETDFYCINQSGSTYLLQATAYMNVFGRITRFFLCIDLQKVRDDVYQYYIASEYETFVQDNIYAIQDAIATLDQACNRVKPYPIETYIMLTKKEGSISNECPQVIQGVSNVTLESLVNGTSVKCYDNQLGVLTSQQHIKFTYNCDNTFTIFSENGFLSCVHYVTSGSTTYLAAFNHDTYINEPKNYRYMCYAIQQEGVVIHASITPGYCTNATTATNPGYRGSVRGVSLTMTSLSVKLLNIVITHLGYFKLGLCACSKKPRRSTKELNFVFDEQPGYGIGDTRILWNFVQMMILNQIYCKMFHLCSCIHMYSRLSVLVDRVFSSSVEGRRFDSRRVRSETKNNCCLERSADSSALSRNYLEEIVSYFEKLLLE